MNKKDIEAFMEHFHQNYTVTCEHMEDELDFLTNQQLNQLIHAFSNLTKNIYHYKKLLHAKSKTGLTHNEEDICSYLNVIEAASRELAKKFKQSRRVHH